MRFARIFLLIAALIASRAFPISASYAADGDSVKLDADVISYEESTGVATAEGNVRVSDSEFSATAPYLEYDNNAQRVTALSAPGQRVVVYSAGKRLEGDRLDYNLETRRGRLTNPNGKIDEFYVRGREIDVLPSSETKSKKRSRPGESAADDDLAAVWRGAVLTTCDKPHPHYRIEAKSVTIYPGRKMVIHSPKAYLGRTPVLVSPFDMTVSLNDRHASQKIFPRFGYDRHKGAGLGATGSFNWESGGVMMDFIGWSEDIFEMDALATHWISPSLSLYAGARREYDRDFDETDWRYRWGANYVTPNGWAFSAGWTRHELLAVEKRAGEISRYLLERNPEVNVSSPWFNDQAAGGRYRVFGVWGSYRDVRWGSGSSYGRSGLGVQITGEPGARENVTPFYNATYTHYFYDDGASDTQRVLDARVGLLYRAGRFDLKTAYLRQWVWGRSPLAWDAQGKREEVYQEISVLLPMSSPEFYWRVGVRAAYDFNSDDLAEMVYKLAYNQHCLLWEAVYRDDLRGSDDWFGLTLSVNDTPNKELRLFGGGDLSDPFAH